MDQNHAAQQASTVTMSRPPGRRGARFWADPRFLVGVVLIAASVAATVFVVGAADAREPLLSARHALVPGATVHLDDFVVASVDVPGADAAYVSPDDVPAEGAVVTRTVGAGELVPASALGSAASVDERSVVVETSGALASTVVAGASVDVWGTPKLDAGAYGPPAVLVPAAVVVSVAEATGIVVGGTDGSRVELLVPQDAVAAVLAAVSNGSAISIVATSAPAAGSAG